MSKLRVLLLVTGILAMALLAGCRRQYLPNVTATPPPGESEAQLMGTLEAEAMATQMAQASVATVETPMPTEPPVVPTEAPTEVPTEVPTAAPTEVPTAAATEAPTAAAPAGETTYTVQPGDNLFRIALRHGVSLETLAAHNGITNPHQIYVGQVIRIPGGGVTPPPSPPSPGGTYTVQPGENLYRIALRFNLSYIYLASYNGIANPHQIYVGQVLRIPAVP